MSRFFLPAVLVLAAPVVRALTPLPCPPGEPSTGTNCAYEGLVCTYGNQECCYPEATADPGACSCGPSLECACSADLTFGCYFTERCQAAELQGGKFCGDSCDGCDPPIAPPPLSECPESPPSFGENCNGLQGRTCSYNKGCCHTSLTSGCNCIYGVQCDCPADGGDYAAFGHCMYLEGCGFFASAPGYKHCGDTCDGCDNIPIGGRTGANECPADEEGGNVNVQYDVPEPDCPGCRKFAGFNYTQCADGSLGWELTYTLGSRAVVTVVSCCEKFSVKMTGTDASSPFSGPDRAFFEKIADGVDATSAHKTSEDSLDKLTMDASRKLAAWGGTNFPIDYTYPDDGTPPPENIFPNDFLTCRDPDCV